MHKFLGWFSAILLLSGCASTFEAEGGKQDVARPVVERVVFPHYQGETTRIAVFPIAMTKKAMADFPEYTDELKKQSVGFSLWNHITDALYDTRRFKFVEISEEIVGTIINQWWLGESGMVDPATALQMGKLKQAEDFIYGEISQFGVDTVAKVRGVKQREEKIFRVGVHLRYVNGETLEYVPASGLGRGGTIDAASESAIRQAIYNLIQRLD